MIKKEITYGYKDLGILGAEISYIKSRSECNPYVESLQELLDDKRHLPIIASPMASVVSDKNYEEFNKNEIYAVIPRNIPFEKRIELLIENTALTEKKWVAFGKNEFEELFCDETQYHNAFKNNVLNVCVDIANGHMADLYDSCKKAKRLSLQRGYDLTIMTGNINNPKTYDWIRRLNSGFFVKYNQHTLVIDYIRVGIGGGDGCTTTPQTGVHNGQASLIDECNTIYRKYEGHCCPKIIADGGIKGFGDVVKALALGAHYVMIGSIFSRMIESAGKKTITGVLPSDEIEDYVDFDYNSDTDVWVATYKDGTKHLMDIDVTFFGMASGNGQRSINGDKTKVSEGTTKILKVNFTLEKWSKIMAHCIRCAMSYCNSFTLEDFIGKQELVVLSQNELNSLNK